MKKKICGVMIIISCAIMCSACGDSLKEGETVTEDIATDEEYDTEMSSDDDAKEDIDVQAVADDILSGGDFKDTLAAVDGTMALTRLYALDESEIEEAAFYTNSNATAEEIAVIKTISAGYVETVENAYKNRIYEQEEACRDYLPDEMTKLESAVIYTHGNYVILCVSNDNASAEKLIEDLFN